MIMKHITIFNLLMIMKHITIFQLLMLVSNKIMLINETRKNFSSPLDE